MTTTIAGLLNIADSDRTYVESVGQRLVVDAMQMVIERHRASLERALRVFVAGDITEYSMTVKSSGGGYLQRLQTRTRPETVRPSGEWTAQFPLEGFGDQMAASDVAMAYMTVSDLQRTLNTIMERNVNTVRRELLSILFRNTVRTFADELRGSLSVQPLANGDAVLYPPILGASAAATENHYLVTNYVVADISATNDPVKAAVEELEEHFGETPGGDNIVFFAGTTICEKIEVLTGFVAVEDAYVRTSALTDVPVNLPTVPGKVVGRYKGAWVVQWRRVPANYSITVHLEAEPPCLRRIDLPETGLRPGLQLVSGSDLAPLETAIWRNRFGFGVANRLNGVVQQYKASGNYDIPTVT